MAGILSQKVKFVAEDIVFVQAIRFIGANVYHRYIGFDTVYIFELSITVRLSYI